MLYNLAGEGESAAKSIQHQYCILIGINQDESIAKQIKKQNRSTAFASGIFNLQIRF